MANATRNTDTSDKQQQAKDKWTKQPSTTSKKVIEK